MEKLDLLNFPCFGHTLQLSVKKSFDTLAVSRKLSRVRRLVNYFRKSTKSTYKLVEKQQLLDLSQRDCITRWGSIYNILERLLEQQQAVCVVLLESEKHDVRLLMPSSEEFTVAQEVSEILKTFHFATEIISVEKYPTIGIVHPLIRKLLSVTLKEADGDTTLVKSIKATVSADLKERYQMLDLQKVMKIGTYLDPCFKKLTYLGDISRSSVRLEAKDELVAIFKEDHERLTRVESVDSMDSVASVSTAPPSKKKKFACLLDDILETSVHCDNQTEDEIAEAKL